MTTYITLLLIFALFLSLLRQKKRRRRKRREENQQERIIAMNELIRRFIGKRCKIHGDLGISAHVTVISVQDAWMEAEDDKGKKLIFNLAYISQICEAPLKKK